MYVEFHNRAYPKNMAVLDRLVARRHELATLLGFAHWADYITANKMVGSAKNASDFIDRVVEASGARADADYEMLLQRKRKDDPTAEQVDAWQSGYYQEQVRKTDYDFDSHTLRPYYPYARVQQGVLDVTAKLFGVEFKPRTDIPVWHPSVECFEMFEDGKLVGRFYLDMHPRADKYSHAAQFDIRTGIAGRQIPEAALVCNFPGGEANDPGLMEHSDVRTFFHEFGHLVHTLFAGRQEWNGVSGIRTEHDFVEAPSQMLEEWTMDPAVLATFAKHHETNEPVPAALVRQMVRASEFGKGLMVRRQMVYARLSLSVYDRDPKQVDTDRLVKDITQRYQRIPYVDGTHLQTSFGHLEGYSAVYYTYMWSLVIAKDLFSQFDAGNLLASTTARRYRDTVLAPGGSKPAAKLVEDFLGRPFDFRAYQAWLSRDTQ
jgi:thimet oligopeptidase